MLKIYHRPRMRSLRVIWLCEELGIPYEIATAGATAAERAAPEYRKLNPVGKVPAISDGEFSMFESVAIMEWLLERDGKGHLRPAPGTPQSGRYLQWMWFAEATMSRPIGEMMQHLIMKPEAERIPAVVEDARLRAVPCLDAVEAAVAHGKYLVDDTFTAADIVMGYTLTLARRVDLLTPHNYPNINEYMARLEHRPAFQKAQTV